MTTISALVAFLIFPLGVYELASGQMPGGPQHWGPYRWLTTPLRIRIAALIGLAACIGLVLWFPPRTLLDVFAAGVGLVVGGSIVLGSRKRGG